MQQRPLGLSGFSVSLIGQGTWRMEHDNRSAAIRALQTGIDLGMTHIDTAEMYGNGIVEELVAEAITGRRHEVFLASKVLPQNASRQGTIQACERSLRRLQTEQIDLYLLHWRGHFPLEETFAAFETLQQQGKIRSFGVSNFDILDLEETASLIDIGKIVCNQVLYHLEERAIEQRIIAWCQKHGITVVGYSPFGAGNFPSLESKSGQILAEIAARYGRSPYQVALQYLLRHDNMVVIPKTSRVEAAQDNAAAASLQLDEEDILQLDLAFPLKRRRSLPTI